MEMTRERLEALSYAALIRIAEQEGLEVPPDVDRILLVDLILEMEEEERLDHELANNGLIRVEQKKYDLTPSAAMEGEKIDIVLPESYPQTRISLMIRDPFWAFAYWDLKQTAGKSSKKDGNGDNLFLRVQRLGNQPQHSAVVVEYFDIQVKMTDRSWYINIPHQDSRYRVELILHSRTGDNRLGVSNTVKIPHAAAAEASGGQAEENDAILLLSGIRELGISVPGKPAPHRINAFEEEAFIP